MPGVSSSGNCNPTSMMTISFLYSKNMQLRPTSSKPPSGTKRTASGFDLSFGSRATTGFGPIFEFCGWILPGRGVPFMRSLPRRGPCGVRGRSPRSRWGAPVFCGRAGAAGGAVAPVGATHGRISGGFIRGRSFAGASLLFSFFLIIYFYFCVNLFLISALFFLRFLLVHRPALRLHYSDRADSRDRSGQDGDGYAAPQILL